MRQDLDFWARIDGATTAANQETLVKEFLGKIETQCIKLIRERAKPETLDEARRSNDELMKFVYLIVEKS